MLEDLYDVWDVWEIFEMFEMYNPLVTNLIHFFITILGLYTIITEHPLLYNPRFVINKK